MSELPTDREESGAGAVFRAVVVEECGPSKIRFVKLIRAATGLGLKEAKEIADRARPFVLVICEEPEAKKLAGVIATIGGRCKLTDYDASTQPAIPDGAPFRVPEAPEGSGCTVSASVFALMVGGAYGVWRLLT
jgi:hypothetical protein